MNNTAAPQMDRQQALADILASMRREQDLSSGYAITRTLQAYVKWYERHNEPVAAEVAAEVVRAWQTDAGPYMDSWGTGSFWTLMSRLMA